MVQEFYLARDSEGNLGLYNQKPVKKVYTYNEEFPKFKREVTCWVTSDWNKYGLGIMCVDKALYPEITFENSPRKITFKIE